MTLPVGNDAAHAAFAAAMAADMVHHAWLFAGPEGIGKASFARAAAMRLLADAVTPGALPPGFDVPENHQTRRLIEAGSHPDYRELKRLPKDSDKTGQELARSIPIAQVRALLPMFAMKPSLSPRRVVVIDAIDDVERPGASNALLKSLEEPPAGTIFLLVSHAPGRLLPTIRSRCRLLRFDPLGDDDMARIVREHLGNADEAEVAALVRAGAGSPGRALGFAGLDLAALDDALAAIARDGDRSNARRVKLAKALALRAAQPRYEAFLDRAPAFIAESARVRHGERLRVALDSYDAARALSASARGLSLDAQGTVYEMAGLVAALAK
ncbi:DNA polymerase III subunit delta' [Sphingomonas sp. H39-1-10]|uniref:DNA polymerase III subunit delta' n=1 Tax=Sphingomonas TaxID=13687 RepID=UPI00088AD339|nr:MULTISPECIES: DNA polymerase III subunit delta' [Sphingomonas]MDF0491209.1 DNA polymerase III subunit delta' [Sphingomonas pollutisoli]SDA36351.1 DNA polymerase-3 subunit delta' [Sphingomonas sp. NFR15]